MLTLITFPGLPRAMVIPLGIFIFCKCFWKGSLSFIKIGSACSTWKQIYTFWKLCKFWWVLSPIYALYVKQCQIISILPIKCNSKPCFMVLLCCHCRQDENFLPYIFPILTSNLMYAILSMPFGNAETRNIPYVLILRQILLLGLEMFCIFLRIFV